MKIWFQLISSEARVPHFFEAVRRQSRDAAGVGTEVTVRGTTNGGLFDQHASLLQLDEVELLNIASREVAQRGYSVYAMANCLDPALDGLREILDVPVVSLMEAGCFVASLVGDRFGVIAPNSKMRYRIADLLGARGYEHKLAGITSLQFDHVPDMDKMFTDRSVADNVIQALADNAEELVASGAEVILIPGPVASLVAREKIQSLHGAVVLDMYAALINVAEGVGRLVSSTGLQTSRAGRYAAPPAAAVASAFTQLSSEIRAVATGGGLGTSVEDR